MPYQACHVNSAEQSFVPTRSQGTVRETFGYDGNQIFGVGSIVACTIYSIECVYIIAIASFVCYNPLILIDLINCLMLLCRIQI
jgi:hypothetical protein